jgi:hypothetical protein
VTRKSEELVPIENKKRDGDIKEGDKRHAAKRQRVLEEMTSKMGLVSRSRMIFER